MCESKLEAVDEMTKEREPRKKRGIKRRIGESQMVTEIYIESHSGGNKTGLHRA